MEDGNLALDAAVSHVAPAEPPVEAPAVRPVEAADQAEVVTPDRVDDERPAGPAPSGRGVRPGAS